ncbi:hypothetical protein J1614_009047 [Plenodomus biglobosus]|nr:hypothetical protein J1614_009047 [Plenodomus biglobosus]
MAIRLNVKFPCDFGHAPLISGLICWADQSANWLSIFTFSASLNRYPILNGASSMSMFPEKCCDSRRSITAHLWLQGGTSMTSCGSAKHPAVIQYSPDLGASLSPV